LERAPWRKVTFRNSPLRGGVELAGRFRQRAVFAVGPIADNPLVMVLAERESRGFYRILVLTPGSPELLSRRGLAHIGRPSARLYLLGFSKVQSVHCCMPRFCIGGHESPILQRPGVRHKRETGQRREAGLWHADGQHTVSPSVLLLSDPTDRVTRCSHTSCGKNSLRRLALAFGCRSLSARLLPIKVKTFLLPVLFPGLFYDLDAFFISEAKSRG
jgi:hypothetical protein